jgi:hypothetical protein
MTNTRIVHQHTSHTPEPWRYEMDPSVSNILAPDPTGEFPNGIYVAEIDGEDVGRFATYEQHEANARRICAAVNACQGIPTAALESSLVKELLKPIAEFFADTHSNKERN